MSKEEWELLGQLFDCHKRGAFAQACDGKSRAIAHMLEKRGYAEWKGTSYGSSFWAITGIGSMHYMRGEAA